MMLPILLVQFAHARHEQESFVVRPPQLFLHCDRENLPCVKPPRLFLHCDRENFPSISTTIRLRGGGASVLETAANIFTDIVPAGMLPVASGLAIASGSLPVKTARQVGFAVVALFALAAHRTLVLIAEAVEASGVSPPSLSGVWKSSQVLGGAKTVWLVDASVALLTFGCCIYYACFIGDLLSAAAAGMLPTSHVPASRPSDSASNLARRRSTHILAASACVLLPLCLLRDLSLLAPFSIVGVLACAYCTLFIDVRAMDGSYAEGGRFDLALKEEGTALHLLINETKRKSNKLLSPRE